MPSGFNASDRFATEWTSALIDLQRFGATARKRVLSRLRLLQDDLIAEIQRFDIEGVSSVSERRKRTEQLLADVEEVIDASYAKGGKVLKSDLRDLASVAHETTVHIFNTVFTTNITRVTLTKNELAALADKALVLGEPALDWWDGQSEQTRRRFVQEMRMGVMAGETNDQLSQRVRGRATGRTIEIELQNGSTRRVREFSGGLMQTSAREADALVRTSVQSVSNATILATYKENEDLLKGWAALTTLDNRTSKICIARTGASWLLNGDPMPDSSVQEQFPGPPPWHFNCRTTLVPVLKTWNELIKESTGQDRKILETTPDSVRASMDGLVPSKIKTFDDWLEHKGDDFARAKLGPELFELWKSDKITLSQLIDQSGQPRTLAEIRAEIGIPKTTTPPPPIKVDFNPKGLDTFHQYSDGQGNWTAERIQLHNDIVDHFMKDAVPVEDPSFIMMGGGPASGKSSIIKAGKVKMPKSPAFVDPDEIKKLIPEFKKMSEAGDSSAAAFVHEESSEISKMLMRTGAQRRVDVVLDGTGNSSLESLRKKVLNMKSKGMRVIGNYVTVDTKTALARNLERYEKTGRLVPPAYVKAVHASISEVLPKALAEGLFDEFTLWDTNLDGQVRLVAKLDKGKLVIVNDKLWQRFLKKAEETLDGS